MLIYSVRRLLQALIVLFLASAVIFAIVHLIPGDPALNLAGASATKEQVQAIRHNMGLDHSIFAQYFIWVTQVLHGNLGYSFLNGYSVSRLLWQRIPASAELAVVAILVAILFAFPLGIFSAINAGGIIDLLCSAFSALSFAVPQFILLTFLILLFSIHIPLFPSGGRPSLSQFPVKHLLSLVLPALTLSFTLAGMLMRYIRSSMLEVISQDYIRTAYAKGLGANIVILKHVLRNSLIPVVTIMALQMGGLFGKTIIVETIYAWPGIGRLVIQSIDWRDYSIFQAVILFIVAVYLVANFVADLLYGVLDPTIRYQ